MKNILKNKALLIIFTLLIGGIIGFFISTLAHLPIDSLKDHQHTSLTEVWTCAMHPHIRQNEPGKCPICGMELIPLEQAGDSMDPMAISMSPTAMKLADVQTMIVGKGNANKSVQLIGKVQADERLLATQTSHIPGRIEQLTVNFTGEYITSGQTIARVYSPELITAQEELFEAQKMQQSQPQLFTAAKEKLKNWKLTDNQIDKILAAGKPGEQFPIQSNSTGYVTKKLVNQGDYIKIGQPIYEVVNLSKVWILFDVYESDIPWIKKGNIIEFTVQSLPGEKFRGSISYVDPVIDPVSRVAKARIEIANPGLKLKPEMFASGNVSSNVGTSGSSSNMVVPKSAVMWTGKRSVVYVKNSTDQQMSFIMREVILGPTLGDEYIIESGLKEGEEIVVNGTFSIDAAAQLAGKPSMMNPEGDQVMTGHNHGGITNSAKEENASSNVKTFVDDKVINALAPLYKAYFEMKNALVQSDMKKSLMAGEELKKDLAGINMSLFSGNAHSIWMKYHEELNAPLNHIEHLQNIESVREAFIGISNAMIGLTESFDTYPKTIYIQHCPMADNNHGADWISLEKEIKNPYYGDMMLTCGEVKSVIN